MRQWLSGVLLAVGVVGGLAIWTQCRADDAAIDEAAVNQKVEARLHQVLIGMLEKERLAHAAQARR